MLTRRLSTRLAREGLLITATRIGLSSLGRGMERLQSPRRNGLSGAISGPAMWRANRGNFCTRISAASSAWVAPAPGISRHQAIRRQITRAVGFEGHGIGGFDLALLDERFLRHAREAFFGFGGKPHARQGSSVLQRVREGEANRGAAVLPLHLLEHARP